MATITLIGLPSVLTHLNNLKSALDDIRGLRAELGSRQPYSLAVHEGARAHTITATNRRALAWQGASHPIRSVHHPGNAPNRFLHEVFVNRRSDITHSLAQGIENSTRNAGLDAGGPMGHKIDDVLKEAQAHASVGADRPRHRGGTLRDTLHVEFRKNRSFG